MSHENNSNQINDIDAKYDAILEAIELEIESNEAVIHYPESQRTYTVHLQELRKRAELTEFDLLSEDDRAEISKLLKEHDVFE